MASVTTCWGDLTSKLSNLTPTLWLPIWTVLQNTHEDRIWSLCADAHDLNLTLTAGNIFFFPLSRPFPATTGDRARTQRRLLCSVSAKGTVCVTSITPRGRLWNQTLSSVVLKLPLMLTDLWSLGDRAKQLAAQLLQIQVSLHSFPCC